MPSTVSNTEIATRPSTSTSSVLSERCTSTLSMTTWKNSGETSPNNCRKNDATSTSPSRWRYLWIAPRNQVMSNRRVMSDNPARRVIRISPPSQTATQFVLASSTAGRGSPAATGPAPCPRRPWRPAGSRHRASDAIAGNGVPASRDQSVRQARALSPRSLAHRSISGAPILSVPSRCLICSASAATPWRCSSVTRASRPGSTRSRAVGFSAHLLLQGDSLRVRRAAAPAAAAGSPADRRSASRQGPRPPGRSSTP